MKTEEILQLASLARLAITHEEAERLRGDINGVLAYVSVINEISGTDDGVKTVGAVHNVLREDVVTNQPGEYTEVLLAEAPQRTDNYLQVKKILNAD